MGNNLRFTVEFSLALSQCSYTYTSSKIPIKNVYMYIFTYKYILLTPKHCWSNLYKKKNKNRISQSFSAVRGKTHRYFLYEKPKALCAVKQYNNII